MKLTLYTKTNCHLCEIMKEVIQPFKEEFEFEYEEIDIESDKTLFGRYCDKIPLLFINEKLFAKYKVDGEELKKRLS